MCVKKLKPADIRANIRKMKFNFSHSRIAGPSIDRSLTVRITYVRWHQTLQRSASVDRGDAPRRDALKSYKLQANVCNLPRRVVDLAGEQTRWPTQKGS